MGWAPATGNGKTFREVPAASHVIARPRLYEQLQAGLDGPVTLVGAPAGWGKTVLASAWIEGGLSRTAAWVDVEAGDDIVGFWRALARALQPVAGPELDAALLGLTAGTADAEQLPDALAAALRLADRPVVLVLDGLQKVSAPHVHAGLVRLIERAPPALSLLVLTRRDPPWPLAKLRLAGLLTEVGPEDLAFRVDEAAALFSVPKVDLDVAQVRTLVERTEGWAAGLRLVALHLQGRPDVDAAVVAFSGNDHSVAGYLVAEVLDEQPPELLRFLRTISMVEFVCADLATALTGRRDSEQLLDELVTSHLCIQVVDRPGRWYHLHRLLGDILKSRPVPRQERRDRWRRAAEWYRRNGMPLDAIRSASAGALWRLAAELIGRHITVFVLSGQAGEFERLLADIPRSVLASHGELACGLAATRVVQGKSGEVAELLDLARAGLDGLPEARAARIRLVVDLVAGGLARLRGDWAGAVALYQHLSVGPLVLARLGLAGAELLPVLVDNILGTAALLMGDLPTAERHLRDAVAVQLDAVVLPQLNASAYLTLLHCERGELDMAESAARDVVSRGSQAGFEGVGQIVAAHLTLAWVALDRGDWSAVDGWLGRVAEIEAAAPEPHARLKAALLVAARREAAGDREGALSHLRSTAAAIDLEALPPALRQQWLLAEATLLARLRDVSRARALLDDLEPAATDSVVLATARLLVLLDDVPAAVVARERVERGHNPRARLDAALLDTVLFSAVGDDESALDRLEDAVAAAAPWSLRRPYLAEVIDLRPLLERLLERGTVAPTFVVDLLHQMSEAPVDVVAAQAAVDPLTKRESTILRYLASTLSNAEIAADLYVSVNTVKSHERAVYRKLGVSSRRQAVDQARLLGLL
jgi:LuxR family transcriptional regulator, maltose regulon positive regulatory protein